MKLNVKLTADELMNVVDAAMDEAIDRGFDDNDEDFVEDMLAIVDAALSAMGIEITEDADSEEVDTFGVPTDYDSDFDEEEEEEEDDDDEEDLNPIEEMVFIKNGKRTISQANATMLLNMAADCIMRDDRVPNDRKWEVTQSVFLAFAQDHGLECVEMDGE